ncbi:MAG: site-2 protease family protein, partial [Planctomycetota bacterium]
MSDHSETIIPPLRLDLEIYEAPAADSGIPAYMIHDPLHATFDQASWFQARIMQLMDKPQKLKDLFLRVTRETTIKVTESELAGFCSDIITRGLSQSSSVKPVAQLVAEKNKNKMSAFKWLLHHYLYFRIPLIYPDAFLEKTVNVVKLFIRPATAMLWFITALFGLFFLVQHTQQYVNTFLHLFHWHGALFYSVALILIKLTHEFSHAYTAKYFGNRVPRMGLAFIVLWPIPFCDVTDSWKMKDRKKRLVISTAGVAAEIVIAGIALFVWGITPPGILHSLAFILSSVTLLSTLLVNLNPAMRFDGYYIFSDLLGVDNLQMRAFNLTKYYLRKYIFGFGLDNPEESLRGRKRFLMVVYSLYAWVYRFFLYLGIAVLVYYMFTKSLGIFLFAVEIIFFIVSPVVRELKLVVKNISKVSNFKRLFFFSGILLAVILWLLLPLKRNENIPAVTVASSQQLVFAPNSGQLLKLNLAKGKE